MSCFLIGEKVLWRELDVIEDMEKLDPEIEMLINHNLSKLLEEEYDS
jgi:hypothetical protein